MKKLSTMRLATINSPLFQESFKKLQTGQLPLKTAFRIKKFVQNLGPELKSYEQTRQDLIERYAARDDKGELIKQNKDGQIDPKGLFFTFPSETRELWSDAFQELEEITTEYELKIHVKDLKEVNLTAQDLLVLEDILEGLEEFEEVDTE